MWAALLLAVCRRDMPLLSSLRSTEMDRWCEPFWWWFRPSWCDVGSGIRRGAGIGGRWHEGVTITSSSESLSFSWKSIEFTPESVSFSFPGEFPENVLFIDKQANTNKRDRKNSTQRGFCDHQKKGFKLVFWRKVNNRTDSQFKWKGEVNICVRLSLFIPLQCANLFQPKTEAAEQIALNLQLPSQAW